jgi:hypothetical protein
MRSKLKTLFEKHSLEQIVFDLIVILFLFLFDFMLARSGKTIVDFLNPVSALIVIWVIQILVSYQLGRVYMAFNRKQSGKFQNALLNITVVLVFLFLFIGLPVSMNEFGFMKEEGRMMWAFLGGVGALLAGALLGFNNEKLTFENVGSVAGIIIFVGLFIYLIYLMLHFGADKNNWLLGVGVLIGGLVLCILLFIGIYRIYEFLKRRIKVQSTPKFLKISIGAFFMAIAALSIMIWQSIHVYGQIIFSGKEHGSIDYDYILFTLFLTGILPFRFMMALASPRKVFSVISAVLIILLDIYAIENHSF